MAGICGLGFALRKYPRDMGRVVELEKDRKFRARFKKINH
jgi:hypothetical protein